jgi:hypothetical protein
LFAPLVRLFAATLDTLKAATAQGLPAKLDAT